MTHYKHWKTNKSKSAFLYLDHTIMEEETQSCRDSDKGLLELCCYCLLDYGLNVGAGLGVEVPGELSVD